MRALLLAALVLGLAGVAGCADRDEVAQGERSYQGKRDTKPWDNEPLAAEYRGAKWNKGDQAGWETQIKSRQMAQHEHKRIYQ